MCIFRKKYNNKVKYNCIHCLKIAYVSELNGYNGYVSDEDLITSSNKKLKHK